MLFFLLVSRLIVKDPFHYHAKKTIRNQFSGTITTVLNNQNIPSGVVDAYGSTTLLFVTSIFT